MTRNYMILCSGQFKQSSSGIPVEGFISRAYTTIWEDLCVDTLAGDAGRVYA